MELFKCEPLRARISAAQCDVNRRRGTFACDKCPGLGAGSVIDPEEVAVKSKICSVEGCSTVVHARGMCWKHERSELGIDPNTGKPLTVKAKPVKSAVKSGRPGKVVSTLLVQDGEPFAPGLNVHYKQAADLDAALMEGLVVNAAGEHVPFGVDPVILLALREAWATKEAQWLSELSGLKPGKAICYTADMVAAVEDLGY